MCLSQHNRTTLENRKMPPPPQDYQALLNAIVEGTADDATLEMVHVAPHGRAFAALVTEKNIPRLLELGLEGGKLQRCAAWRLLRPFTDRPEISDFLRTRWAREQTDDERNVLLWRILDHEQLPLEIHADIWAWINGNRQSFLNGCRWYFDPLLNGPSPLYRDVYHLLECSVNPAMDPNADDRRFPITKTWIYLATAALFSETPEEKASARQLLKTYGPGLDGTFYVTIRGDLEQILDSEITS